MSDADDKIEPGNYVKWEDADGKSLKGMVLSKTTTHANVVPVGEEDSAAVSVALADLTLSRYAGMRGNIMNNLIEVAENVVIHNGWQTFMYKHKFFGPEGMSFLLADSIHELMLKDVVAPFSQMLQSPYIPATDEKKFFNKTDFVNDPLRKLPFTLLYTQIIQKMMYRKTWGHGFMRNLISQYIALAGTNIIDRNVRRSKDEAYRYP